jgi:hypothetical protein
MPASFAGLSFGSVLPAHAVREAESRRERQIVLSCFIIHLLDTFPSYAGNVNII